MTRAQYNDVIYVGNLALRGRLVGVNRETESLTKNAHVTDRGEVHQINEGKVFFCVLCQGKSKERFTIPPDEVVSAVKMDDNLVVLPEIEEEKTKAVKALLFTDRIPMGKLRIWEMERAYFFEPDPDSLSDLENAHDLYLLLGSDGIAPGGDLVVNNTTRKTYLVPMEGRLFLMRFLYQEEMNDEPKGSVVLKTSPTRADDDRVAIIRRGIGVLPELPDQDLIRINPKRLALRDRAAAVLKAGKTT